MRRHEETECDIEAERPARCEGTTGVGHAERLQLCRRPGRGVGEQEEVQRGGGGDAQEQVGGIAPEKGADGGFGDGRNGNAGLFPQIGTEQEDGVAVSEQQRNRFVYCVDG